MCPLYNHPFGQLRRGIHKPKVAAPSYHILPLSLLKGDKQKTQRKKTKKHRPIRRRRTHRHTNFEKEILTLSLFQGHEKMKK